MKTRADWMIQIDLRNFFDRHAELRARTSKGTLKDKIHVAVFAPTLESKFTKGEIATALDSGYIAREQIQIESGVRNIYVWLDSECKFQPTWYKRWAQRTIWIVKENLASIGFIE